MRTRRTLRGHLAKIYAMHWGTDSRWVPARRVLPEACAVVPEEQRGRRAGRVGLQVGIRAAACAQGVLLAFSLGPSPARRTRASAAAGPPPVTHRLVGETPLCARCLSPQPAPCSATLPSGLLWRLLSPPRSPSPCGETACPAVVAALAWPVSRKSTEGSCPCQSPHLASSASHRV